MYRSSFFLRLPEEGGSQRQGMEGDRVWCVLDLKGARRHNLPSVLFSSDIFFSVWRPIIVLPSFELKVIARKRLLELVKVLPLYFISTMGSMGSSVGLEH